MIPWLKLRLILAVIAGLAWATMIGASVMGMKPSEVMGAAVMVIAVGIGVVRTYR